MRTESTIRVDGAKNRIYLDLQGFHDLEEAQRLRDLYAEAIQKCRPGFTVLADVSKYRPGAAEVQEVHGEAAKLAEAAGVNKVARVIGDKPLGGMQIDRIARTEATYEARNFATFEEAEDYLDGETSGE